MDILIGGAGVIPQLFPAVRAVDEVAEDKILVNTLKYIYKPEMIDLIKHRQTPDRGL